MITIFYIANARGWPLTPVGTFDPDGDDVAEFRDEDEAYEELATNPKCLGCSVERFERVSAFPDFTATPFTQRSAA